MTKKINRMVRDSMVNAVIGASARIQARRSRKGRKRLVRRNFASVPRRSGGMFYKPTSTKGLVSTTLRTVAPNVGVLQQNFQTPNVRSEGGTETLGVIGPLEETPDYQVVYAQQINPADPGVFPSLSSISNNFQKFRTRNLKITFTPMSSSTVDGQVLMAFTPDVKADPPASYEDFLLLLGAKQGQLYGSPTVLQVPASQLQQAYNIQTIEKPASENDGTPMNVTGQLFVALYGVQEGGYGKSLGSLTLSYGYDLSIRQAAPNSNGMSGTVKLEYNSAYVDTVHATEFRNYQMVRLDPSHETNGVFRLRVRNARHLLVNWSHAISGLVLQGYIGGTWQNIDTIYSVDAPASGTDPVDHLAVYVLADSNVKMRLLAGDGATAAVSAQLMIHTLPAKVPLENEWRAF